MPNIYISTNTASAPQTVAVGTTSGTVIAGNVDRAGLIITNLSTGTIYLAFDGLTAILNGGGVIGANGGVFNMDEFTFTKGTVTGIGNAANMTVAVQEFYR